MKQFHIKKTASNRQNWNEKLGWLPSATGCTVIWIENSLCFQLVLADLFHESW